MVAVSQHCLAACTTCHHEDAGCIFQSSHTCRNIQPTNDKHAIKLTCSSTLRSSTASLAHIVASSHDILAGWSVLSCRKVAEYQRVCAFKVARQLQRQDQVRQTTAFLVWQQYTQHCQQMRAGLQQLVRRAAHAKLRTAFAAWSQYASAKAGRPFCNLLLPFMAL